MGHGQGTFVLAIQGAPEAHGSHPAIVLKHALPRFDIEGAGIVKADKEPIRPEAQAIGKVDLRGRPPLHLLLAVGADVYLIWAGLFGHGAIQFHSSRQRF